MSKFYGKGRSGYHIRLGVAESASAHGGQVLVDAFCRRFGLWEKLARVSPREPARFFEALLKTDRGRLAGFYAVVSRADPARRKWGVQRPASSPPRPSLPAVKACASGRRRGSPRPGHRA